MTQAQKDFIARVGAFAAADMAKSGILASLKVYRLVRIQSKRRDLQMLL